MRRPLPPARPRVRSLAPLVLLALDARGSEALACDGALDALSSRCGDVCGASVILCVYRNHSQPCELLGDMSCVSETACSFDCIASVVRPTQWTIEWQAKTNAVVVESKTNDTAVTNGSTSVIIHDAISRIDQSLVIPPTVVDLTIVGPATEPSPILALSDSTLVSFSSLSSLRLEAVNLSDWEALPTMPQLRNLSLVGVALTQWLLDRSLDSLQFLSLDQNPRLSTYLDAQTYPSKLQSLSLRSAGLTKIPAALSNLTSLTTLSLDGNALQSNPIVSLPSSLVALSLRDCAVSRVPSNLTALTALESVDLSHNPSIGLTDLPPSVKELRLSRCGLTAFPTAIVQDLKLTTLDLSFNPLNTSSEDLSALLEPFTNLSALELSATSLARVPAAVATRSQLTHLSLALNAIQTIDSLSLPRSLEYLDVARNANVSLHLPAEASAMLRFLNVSGCGLDSLASVSALANLSTLDASDNSLAAAADLPTSLRVLNLSHNQLTALPERIFSLPSLQELDLVGNPIPSGAVASLTTSQIAFLHGLRAFAVDASVFRSANCSSVAFSFGYAVCVANDTSVADREDAHARVNRNLVIIAGTIGTALVVLTLLSYAMRRGSTGRRRDAKRLLDDGGWPTELASDREMTDAEWRALQMWTFWDDQDVLRLRIPWDLVRDRQVIGSGQYSVLWLARVASQPVFLKALQPTAHRHRDDDGGDGSVAAVASLIREIQLLRRLRHANVVRLVGVTWLNAPTDVQVALEDMANGDLRGYLELTQPPAPPSRWRGGLGDGFALRVAVQVADAVEYLHRRGVAHNDLRSRNVVLDDDCNPKLTGFGRHVFVDPVRDSSDDGEDAARIDAGDKDVPPPTVDNAFLLDAGRWMAPEVLRRHLRGRRRSTRSGSTRSRASTATTATSAASAAADVYAFGVLLLELDTFEMPFAHAEEDDSADDSLDDYAIHFGRRPNAAAAVPPGPHDVDNLRFSSMPGHNSLLGQPTSLQLAAQPLAAPPRAPPVSNVAATMTSAEERYELALLRKLADGVVRVDLSSSTPMGVGELILRCLDFRPENRPTMHQVRDALRAIASEASERKVASRRRASTGSSSGTAANTNTTRSISNAGSQRSLAPVAVATQTVDEDHTFSSAGESSASSSAQAGFFVVQPSPPSK